jgi:hypothetical protein
MCKGNHFCAHNEANLSFFGFFIQFIKKRGYASVLTYPLLIGCYTLLFLEQAGENLVGLLEEIPVL